MSHSGVAKCVVSWSSRVSRRVETLILVTTLGAPDL